MSTNALKSHYLLGVPSTFLVNYGIPRTEKNVTVRILDNTGTLKSDGYVMSPIAELSNGNYITTITFTEVFNGYIEFYNETDNIKIYQSFTVIYFMSYFTKFSRTLDLPYINIRNSSFEYIKIKTMTE